MIRILCWIMCATVVQTGAAIAQELRFGPAVNSRNSDAPRAVAVGDWNEDSLPDYAVTNYFDNSVSIAFGRGDGTFLETAGKVEVGAFPDQIIVGDWDGDGRLDLALTNADEGSVSILIGAPGGGFRHAAKVEVGEAPRDLATGDWDGDGRPDLAVIVGGGKRASLVILRNQSGGRFAPARRILIAGSPLAIEARDFDCDGRPDLAVALREPNRVDIWRGQRRGLDAMPPALLTGAPAAFAIADLDGDGVADLAVALATEPALEILRGEADGTFQHAARVRLDGLPTHLAIANFDADGHLDIAVALGDSDRVQLLTGAGDGSFGEAGFLVTGRRPIRVVARDLNRDNRVDLLVVNHGGKGLSAFMNAGALAPRAVGRSLATCGGATPAPIWRPRRFSLSVP